MLSVPAASLKLSYNDKNNIPQMLNSSFNSVCGPRDRRVWLNRFRLEFCSRTHKLANRRVNKAEMLKRFKTI